MPAAEWESYLAARGRIVGASTCPVRSVADHPSVVGWVRDAGTAQETGALWCAGGLGDQPARWLEAVREVWSEWRRCDAEEIEEARKK